MNRYVIFDSENKMHNIVIWNGDLSVWQPPENMTAIKADEVDEFAYEWEEAAIIILGSMNQDNA